ncbi:MULTISPECIES: helix-turn-helix domain-containing protein [unclassified Chelatococcus]|uniref:IclR family transcriptional regulator n=1 Tax=unclassified Chelatococcus TaxID=2638111 RepID=UPI001BCDED14|nr:helix-turn-helix domain-containing protein [Chelatococcus sp.]MBS7699902.1 helix-turn-helix domain-containing protein [Chelatococcus sp. YT9]MBX3558752.1 helix-turn-helix domain-containing protein [Chelatococcus sp.]
MARQSSSNAGRAAELLVLLSQAGAKGMTLSALAAASDEARSSVHRTLVALADHGFVIQGGNRGSYKLGPGAYALALRTPSMNEVVSTYRPALLEITTKTLLSSYLMVRSGLDTVCLDSQVGQIVGQPFISGIGGRIPLGVGISGSCILGMMEEKARARCMELLTEKYRQWDVPPEKIMSEITFYHRHGYVAGFRRARGIESFTLSVPVVNDNWRGLEVALSVLAPLNMLDEPAQVAMIDQIREIVRRAETAASEVRQTELRRLSGSQQAAQ